MAQDTVKAINVRLPEPLHAELVVAAEDDLRSLQSEILVLLREALEWRKVDIRSRQLLLRQLEVNADEIDQKINLPAYAA